MYMWIRPKAGRVASTDQHCLEQRSIPPHVVLFLIYNVLYFVPLIVSFLLGPEEAGVGDVLNISSKIIGEVCVIYGLGICAFLVGTYWRRLLGSCIGKKTYALIDLRRPHFDALSKLSVMLFCAIFCVSKILIIPTGVYSNYGVGDEFMSGSAWSFSIICSELLIVLSIVALFSEDRHNVRWFIFLSLLNGINLLHGTRFFFIIGCFVGIVYAYTRRLIKFRNIVTVGLPAAFLVLVLSYLVFLYRSHGSSDSQGSTVVAVLSPIIFESVFSQISLINTLTMSGIITLTGHVLDFVSALITIDIPRFLIPDKDTLFRPSIDLISLSPLGAFNGYAYGLITFGIFFPLYYLLWGAVADWLYKMSRQSSIWTIIYVYFTAGYMFRIMRDGYVIPLKLLSNVLEFIVVAILLARLLGTLQIRKSQSHQTNNMRRLE
jgi:hypothetical protein